MPDPRTKLYQALSGKFDLGSQDEFNSKMDNPESRKKLYSAVSNDFDLGSYEEFEGKVASVKKKENSTGTSPSKKLASGATTGSSAGVNSNGFPKIDTNSVAPGVGMQPKAESSLAKEKRLRKELANKKVTPENMDAVMAETDALSASIKANEKAKAQAKSQRVKELETSFYSATQNKDDDAVAEQRLNDAVNTNGIWNNVKSIAKKAVNTVIDGAVIATKNPSFNNLKINEDPLADEKKQAKQDAVKNKETVSDEEINLRAKELYKEKEKENLFLDRANSFLDNMDTEDKNLLKQDRYDKSIHLQEDNVKRLKYNAALQTVAQDKIEDYKSVESELQKLKENGQPFPEELYNKYTSLGAEIKQIGATLNKNEQYVLNNKKDLGTAQQEFDLFKREYGDFNNFAGNIAVTSGELATGILGSVNYLASMSPNPMDRVNAMKGQEVASGFSEDLKRERENLRKPVESIESAEGFLNYTSDLLANQIPILVATSTGAAGLGVVGLSSTGQKYTEMNDEVRQGKATYTPMQMAVAPFLYGGAEVISEIPTLSILKKGGRIIESIARNEAELITKTATQKAIEWSKDYGIDMTKEMSGEQFTNFTQNFNDKYILGKKDVGLLDNTGRVFKDTFTLTSILKAAPQTFGVIAKPFQSKTDLGTLDENSRKIIEFSKQLNTDGLSDVEKTVIQKQIDKVTAESSKIVSNTIGRISNMPGELYDEAIALNSKAGEIKSQARVINDGNLANKEALLKGLSEDYKALQEKRNGIIDGKTTVVDVLPLQEQETLKKQAMEDLVTELNPDGTKDITITNEQVVERANKIYAESKANENPEATSTEPTTTNTEPTSVISENQLPTVPEDYNIVDENKPPVVEQTTPDTKAQPAEVNVAPSVSLSDTQKEEINKLEEERDGKILLEPQGISQEDLVKTPSYINNREVEAEYNAKINKIINEAAPQSNPTADGNVPVGNNPEAAPEQNNEVQPTVKSPTNKGEVGAKLIEVNKRVFGLDDEKSNANAIVMEKTIETMAERAGISKEEMFDKIDFEKGDAKTAEKLSKKGKALFQIIGKNANLSKNVKQFLSDAKALHKKGTDSKTIFMQTGWEKGADGKWKYDMQEGKVEFKQTENGNLEDVLDYPELFDKYPAARKIKIVFNNNMPYSGLFVADKNRIQINNSNGPAESRLTILHEVQHWIQNKEGFSTGGNEATVKSFINDQIKNATDSKVKKAINAFKDLISKKKPDNAKVNQQLTKLKKLLNKDDFALYESIAGEVEARNVEARFNMPIEQRKTTPLSETEDVSRDEQVVLFQGEQGAMLAEDGKFIIYALTDPNVSTPLHEMAHVYEHYLTDAERTTILEDAGHTTWFRETSEHFARGFEKYLADVIAPSPEMKSVFDNFKKWMNEIYNGITASDIDIKLSPEMKKIYDTMLGAKETLRKTVNYKSFGKETEFTVETDNKGEVRIFKKDGTEVPKYTQRKLKKLVDNKVVYKPAKNANYFKILAIAEGGLSENEINLENKKQIQESINNFIPTSEYEFALLEIANGAKFSKESIQKEVGNLDSKWATDQFTTKKLPSIENVAEAIVSSADFVSLDEQEVRNHLIDIIASFGGINDVKESVHELYKKSIDPFQGMNEQEAIEANLEYMTDEEKALYESVQDESNLSEEEKLNYYKDEYRKQFQSLTGEQQQQIYDEEEQGRINSNESDAISDSRGSAEKQEQKEVNDLGEKARQLAKKVRENGILPDWLQVDKGGREGLANNGIGLTEAFAKALETFANVHDATKDFAKAVEDGFQHLKDWYDTNGVTFDEKDLKEKFSNHVKTSERQAENLLNRAISENISEEEAFKQIREDNKKSREQLANRKTAKEIFRDTYRNFVKRATDKQYIAKTLLNKSGMKAVQNLIINSHGASAAAKMQFEEAYEKIYKYKVTLKIKGGVEVSYEALSTKDRNDLDEIIQAKRFIAIDTNRDKRGLEPITHPNFNNKNKSEKFLSGLKKEIGEKKFNDLERRSEIYFETYKNLLKDVYQNGLISKASYDSMSDVDYQPRVFLQFVTNFDGDLQSNKRSNNIDSGGLSADQIKNLKEGDANSLVLNSEFLLMNSLSSRSKAMAMNNVNKRFMTGEFQKAKVRFEALDPKNLKGDDIRFYKYFKELNSKVIDNPITGQTDSGNNKYLYDKTPANFSKNYYYVDGQRHEFFLEDDLHESWNDNVEGFLSSNAKEIVSYVFGSALVKAIATGNNPAFPIVNTPRDFLFTITFSDQYSNILPKAMFQISKDVFKAIKEIRKPQSDVLKKYIEYGGGMDFLSSQGKLKKNSLLGKAMEGIVSANAKDIAKTAFSAATFSKISEYSEMMFRLGIFQRSIQNQLKDLGYTDISEVTDKQQIDDIYNEAVTSARSILDFNQGGSITKDMEAFIPYINVAFQGGRVAATAFAKDPVNTTVKVLQVATLASTVPIGISLTLISAMKSDDDDDKTTYEIYLDALAGISKYQKEKYMNIPTPFKNEEGQYLVLKIAKAQELAPVISITDNMYNNLIRTLAGKKNKSAGDITKEALTAFNNIMPVDLTSPSGFFTRNPAIKATMTYATGHDFFKDEPLSFDIGKVPLSVEGITLSSTEDFYKKIGENYELSPVRTKAVVESFITSPGTNPFVGMLYGGADAISSDKGMKQIGKELAKITLKSFTKRTHSYTSDFNRQLSTNKELEAEIEKATLEIALRKSRDKNIIKEFTSGAINQAEFDKKIEKFSPIEKNKIRAEKNEKVLFKSIDSNIIDIKYEKTNRAKALMIMHYYGDIFDGSKDSKAVLRQMQKAKGILTPATLQEYNKIKKELGTKKRPE